MTIGIEQFRDPREQRLDQMLTQPFRELKRSLPVWPQRQGALTCVAIIRIPGLAGRELLPSLGLRAVHGALECTLGAGLHRPSQGLATDSAFSTSVAAPAVSVALFCGSAKGTASVGVDPVADYVAFAAAAVGDARDRIPHRRGGSAALCSGQLRCRPWSADPARLGRSEPGNPRDGAGYAPGRHRGGVPNGIFASGLPMLSLFWQAAAAVAPKAVQRQQRHNAPPDASGLRELTDLWTSGDLIDIRTARLELSMEFESFDDYWRPLPWRRHTDMAFAAALDTETVGVLADALLPLDPGRAAGRLVRSTRPGMGRGRNHPSLSCERSSRLASKGTG